MPKKTGNNDPTRNNPWVESVQFLVDNLGNPDAFDEIEDKPSMLEVVDHVLAIHMGGWSEQDGAYVNESGRTVDQEMWDLQEDGWLAHKNPESSIIFNTDLVHNIRERLTNGRDAAY